MSLETVNVFLQGLAVGMFLKGITAGWRHDFSKERGIIRKIPLKDSERT